MTDFYMACNIRLKWLNETSTFSKYFGIKNQNKVSVYILWSKFQISNEEDVTKSWRLTMYLWGESQPHHKDKYQFLGSISWIMNDASVD